MTGIMWLGALLVVCGVMMLALTAINRGRLSESHTDPIAGRTLEPSHRGLRFLEWRQYWLGILLVSLGAVTLFGWALV
ncbi:hypothetical protein [Aminobacter sp. DSM 101952]|uniref:hypothetical protein n=1 Tax=Aminobacter sp. DSM 101952 TaxID=2735891 RepID=UPI0012E34FC4|nr:hypothetical protein [Aminobacter sp. DSM 101952]